MNLEEIKSIYCIGIKGAGVAAIAEFFHKNGAVVCGSDTAEVFYTDDILKRNGIRYFENFEVSNIPAEVDLVVYSTAYTEENNVEMAEVKKRMLPMASYPEALGMIFSNKTGISVCGSHGKTTTTAMLAETLRFCGIDPSAIVGSQVSLWKGSALAGKGEYFVAESDEYQNKLKHYNPWSVILTSLDWDHPDFFPDFEAYKNVFRDFVAKIPKTGNLIVWGDSSQTLDVAKNCHTNVFTYGFREDNDFIAGNIVQKENSQTFEIYYRDEFLGFFETKLAGKHNVLNSTSVIAMCHILKMDMEKVKEAILHFSGTSRRFEIIGSYKDIILIDDYAHHPDEIKATLAGARDRFAAKNIWTVFHPHTFTRTKALLEDFAQSFDDTDKVIVIDIYGSARETQGGVSSKELVDLINKYNRGRAEYIATIDEVVEFVKEKSGELDVLITMGAGDVWRIGEKLKSI
jgi:UDP-N-acetylmuramate--alanine ligase